MKSSNKFIISSSDKYIANADTIWWDYYRNSTFKKIIYTLYKLDKNT
jgi:hypothetical protein